MSLERFEFDVNDVIPANLCNILTLLFCIFLLILERTFALCNVIPANEWGFTCKPLELLANAILFYY